MSIAPRTDEPVFTAASVRVPRVTATAIAYLRLSPPSVWRRTTSRSPGSSR